MTKKTKKNDKILKLTEKAQDAFCAAAMSAWFETKLEKDKQILTLSSLAIGGLLIIKPAMHGIMLCIIWIISLLSFVACLFIVLYIFDDNAKIIELFLAKKPGEVEQSTDSSKILDGRILRLEKIMSRLFVIGVLTACALVAVPIFEENNSMNDKVKMNSPVSADFTKGFSSIANIAPVVSQPAGAKPAPSSASVPVPTANSPSSSSPSPNTGAGKK